MGSKLATIAIAGGDGVYDGILPVQIPDDAIVIAEYVVGRKAVTAVGPEDDAGMRARTLARATH